MHVKQAPAPRARDHRRTLAHNLSTLAAEVRDLRLFSELDIDTGERLSPADQDRAREAGAHLTAQCILWLMEAGIRFTKDFEDAAITRAAQYKEELKAQAEALREDARIWDEAMGGLTVRQRLQQSARGAAVLLNSLAKLPLSEGHLALERMDEAADACRTFLKLHARTGKSGKALS